MTRNGLHGKNGITYNTALSKYSYRKEKYFRNKKIIRNNFLIIKFGTSKINLCIENLASRRVSSIPINSFDKNDEDGDSN